jgi:hypothetical protein
MIPIGIFLLRGVVSTNPDEAVTQTPGEQS